MAIVVALASLLAGWLLLKTIGMKVTSGEHLLIGEKGRVVRIFDKDAGGSRLGSIKVAGEIWQARYEGSGESPPKDAVVTVQKVEGMTAVVI